MLKNHLEFLRREPSHSSGKYISKGEGEETKGEKEGDHGENRARFPALRRKRERGRATLEKIKGVRVDRRIEKTLDAGPEHSRARIWITRGWSETCQEARKRRHRWWWWGRGFQSFFQPWRSSSMMRTEGFAVGSSWREGRERDRRGDNASSSIETRVLSLLSPRSLPLLEETGQVSRAREGKTLFASNSALSLPPLPLWTKEGKGSSEGNFFFFFCWVAREVGSFWKKVYSRTG